jgi:PEP-CTERM motif-containing protein
MRSILKFSAAALAVFSMASQSASAQFVQQTSRPVGTTTTWAGVTATNSYTIGNVTATTTGGNWSAAPFTAGGSWSGGFTNGEYLLFGFGNSVTTLDFAGAIYGFGTQGWNNPCCGGMMTLQAYFLGNLVGSFSQGIGGGSATNNNQAPVIAFTSTSAVDRVVLSSTSEFAINQLDVDGVSPIVTPEPTSAAMLAGALAALGFVVRRRNKHVI